MNTKYLIIVVGVILIGASVGLLSWLLPAKGDAEELGNKYYIEVTNCSKVALDAQTSDKEIRELFKSTDYVRADGGQSFLTPIVRVGEGGKKISFGIPIYGVNYWRFKWANPDLYLYSERLEDQENFWKQTDTTEKFEKIRTILSRDNSVGSNYSSSAYIIDLAQIEETNNRTYNSITTFRKAIDKKIKAGEIKPGDLLPVFVKCYSTPVSDVITTTVDKGSSKDSAVAKPNTGSNKTGIQTGFSRISKKNEITWSKTLAEKAEKLIIEFKRDGKVVKQDDVTGETKYPYNPGNEGAGVNTDVVLKVTIDKNKYFLIGDLTITNQLFTCSAN